jgi:TolB-like protein/tetratricopeptide (TPR) repeat protein
MRELRIRGDPVEELGQSPQRLRFGDFEVDLPAGELRKGAMKRRLSGQPFQVLAILLERPGEVVRREALQARLWPDTVVDVDHNLNTAINKIREALNDSAEKPLFIETLPRRGYRFIAPVESVESLRTSIPARGEAASGVIDDEASHVELRRDEGFWIAVLPLKVSGETEDLGDCAAALTEGIVTGLSRFSYLRVISLSSTARYAGKLVDLRTAGRELGARYVLEGSLRETGSKIRVTAQLVDCNSGVHLWAENYDRSFSSHASAEVFDDVVPKIVSTIADTHGVLPRSMSEALRTIDPLKLRPYEAMLRSFAHFQRVNAEEHASARAALERAVQQAPTYADAWAMLSLVEKEEFTHRFNLRPDPLGRALTAARCAIEFAPSNHLAYHALAAAEFFRKEIQSFQIATARAIDLNPMDGFTLAYLGFLTAYAGDWERGGVLSSTARSLNPHHPGWYWFVPCFDAYRKGEYEVALEFARKANMPGFWRTNLAVAAACGQLDQREAAGNALRTLLVQRPDIGDAPREGLAIWWQPDMVEHLVDGLRKAGLKGRWTKPA